MGPLDGIRAIESAEWQAGPSAGAILGDLGADVIKIEDPVRGDGARGYLSQADTSLIIAGGRQILFETVNRSKRGITLNLKHPKGREIFYQLIEKADVFYTNYREKVLQDLGADYETLRHYNPSLIYGKADTFGAKGPWAERRGFDFIAQARSGLMWAMGDRDFPEPMLVYGDVCDEAGATMLAFGLVTALFARERKGIGQKVETSIYGAALHLQRAGISVTSFRGRPWARHSRKRVREPLTNFYRCADGKWIIFAEMHGDEYWPQFARAIGREDLAHDPRFNNVKARRENCQELIQILDEVLASKTLQEWVDILGEQGLAYSPVHDYAAVLDDPQALENNYIVDFEHPTAGWVKFPGFPVNLSVTPAALKCAAPEFGQHTEEVLSELCGLSWEEMARLRDEGVI